MKLMGILTAGLFATSWAAAQAQDVGRVISSTPVTQQVSVPRQVCTQEEIEVQRPNSGAGAAIGAIAGGVLGSASGHGPGRAAATVIGALGGAFLGDRIEGTPEPQMQTVQRCSVQSFVENRVSGYNVVYEYGGKQYSVQMPQDPGPTIALQVTPVAASSPGVAPAPPAYSCGNTYGNAGTVISSTTVTYPTIAYPTVISVPRYVPQIVLPSPFHPSYHGRTVFMGHGRHFEHEYRHPHRRDDRNHGH